MQTQFLIPPPAPWPNQENRLLGTFQFCVLEAAHLGLSSWSSTLLTGAKQRTWQGYLCTSLTISKSGSWICRGRMTKHYHQILSNLLLSLVCLGCLDFTAPSCHCFMPFLAPYPFRCQCCVVLEQRLELFLVVYYFCPSFGIASLTLTTSQFKYFFGPDPAPNC